MQNSPLRLVGRDVLFAHWPVPVEAIREALPAPLTVDTVDGKAWLSVLVHEVSETTLAALPVSEPFVQVNFRTYARFEGESGVYFLSLDTGNRVAAEAGPRLFGLPFHRARGSVRRRDDGTVTLASQRTARGEPQARFDARYRPTGEPRGGSGPASSVERSRPRDGGAVSRDDETSQRDVSNHSADRSSGRTPREDGETEGGEPTEADPDSVTRQLVERHRYFVPGEEAPRLARAVAGTGRSCEGSGVLVGDVSRDPWQLAPVDATLRTNTLFDAAGLGAPGTEPTIEYSPGYESRVVGLEFVPSPAAD